MEGGVARGTLMPGKALRTVLARAVVLGAPGAFRGGLSVHEGWREAGKCDSLSFLRVCLSQMGEAPGGRNGYAPPLRGRWPYPLREHIIDEQ